MFKCFNKKAATRITLEYVIIIILAIVVIIIMALWLFGDYFESSKSMVTLIHSKFLGAGV